MKFDKIKSIKKVGIEETSDLIVEKNHNFFANNFLVHNSGGGKGLAGEGIVQELHKAGYLVLVLSDPKDEIEYGYAQFLPKERYHIDNLRKQGKAPSTQKVKLYHPFTFSIPNQQLPEMNFYTFSIKDLGRKEWGMLLETGMDTDSTKLLVNASNSISNEDGIYGLLHYLQDIVKGKKEGSSKKADPKNFLLSATAGTMKSITEISQYLKPFKQDYFLAKENCNRKLDWKKIIADQESYHVFVSNFIKDEKLKEFIVLILLNKLIEHKNLLKHPVCIVIPEVRKQCPFRPQGYRLFLSNSIKEALSTMRSQGKGMSSVLDTQVWMGVDVELTNSCTTMLIGEMAGAKDIESFSKAMNYKRDIRDQLKKMDYKNSFFVSGEEERGAITIFFPTHMHCEPSYNFFDMCKKQGVPMKRYLDIVSSMKKMTDADEQKIWEKIKRRRKQEKEEKERKKKEKEKTESKSTDEQKEKLKKVKTKSKETLMKLYWDYKQENPEVSDRKIAEKFETTHVTVSKYLKLYQQIKDNEVPINL